MPYLRTVTCSGIGQRAVKPCPPLLFKVILFIPFIADPCNGLALRQSQPVAGLSALYWGNTNCQLMCRELVVFVYVIYNLGLNRTVLSGGLKNY